MTIAQQLKVTKFPFTIKDDKGNEIYYEESSGCWVKKEFDDNGKNIYFEDSDGGIFDRRPKPAQALISQLEEIASRLEEDGLYALQGIKDTITELKNKNMAAPLLEKVDQAHQEFIKNVGALKHATALTTPYVLGDDGLDRAVRRVITSYENYVNIKIKYAEDYFKNN
jgi:hypothetical protein